MVIYPLVVEVKLTNSSPVEKISLSQYWQVEKKLRIHMFITKEPPQRHARYI